MRKLFLILGTQRTGSQALFQAFNLHPDVVCGGEWTQDVAWYRKRATAERALDGDVSGVAGLRPADEMQRVREQGTTAGCYGFKILFRSSDKWLGHPRLAPALLVDRLEAHLTWLKRRPDVHVIQLVRRDGVEWLKSKYLARSTGKFTHSQYPDDARIDVPVHHALRALRAKNWVDRRIASLEQTNPYLRVIYEDFAADNRRGLETCLAFLGCDLSRLPADTRFIEKQSKAPAAAYIRNFDELAAALAERQLDSSALLS
jgi:LPS sulfotransferase NodH